MTHFYFPRNFVYIFIFPVEIVTDELGNSDFCLITNQVYNFVRKIPKLIDDDKVPNLVVLPRGMLNLFL